MNKLNRNYKGHLAMIMCLSLALCGCGSYYEPETVASSEQIQQSTDSTSAAETTQNEDTVTSSAETEGSKEVSGIEVIIDYGDAEAFEAALNEGKNLENKVVQFVAGELHPDSKLGYNVWAGEHLNFISSRNPDIQEGDTVTVRTTTIENLMGSWIINYEKVDNAVMGEDTITYSKANETAAAAESEPSPAETSPGEEAENSYEHNQYYDLVETSSYKDSIGYTIVIHKVLAKKDATVSATLLAYAADGSVIGKSSDKITLTEGRYNFFRYSFDGDVSGADIQANANAKDYSFNTGERNAVEMMKYNQSGDDLYITFEQTGDELGAFAQFKLLLYKGDKIVGTEEGFFSISAENLNGKGTTDVASIWVYGTDFDRVEYVYEP
ncbi:MAG: hypothetical protein J6M90_00100 [Oscillospiraceae bacterium]|nr:hypothetical protein [Oscillospiraceae bacterium]